MASTDVINLIRKVYEQGEGDPKKCQVLSDLQKSEQAWQVCFDILKAGSDGTYPIPAVTFASITLKRKIKRDLASLAQDNHEPLKELIITSLMTFFENKPVRTQLCISLVYLLIQSDKWIDPIVAVTSRLPDSPQKAGICVEYFTVLAEELTVIKDIRLKSVKRDMLREHLKQISTDAHQFLWSLLSLPQQTAKTIKQVLNCYSVWIDGELFDEGTLASAPSGLTDGHSQFPIVDFIVDRLVQLRPFSGIGFTADTSELHDSCTQCMCSLLQSYGIYPGRNRDILAAIYKAVMQRFPSLLGAVNQWTEDIDNTVFNLLKILTTLGYSLSDAMRLDIPDPELNNAIILQCLLEYTKCKHFEVADIMLTFWEEFTDPASNADQSRQLERFGYIFEALIDRLLDLTRAPPDCVQPISHETNSDLFRLRQCAQNIMYSIVCIVGLQKCFGRLYDELNTDDWALAEASIHLMWGCALRLSELESKDPRAAESVEIRYVLTEFIFPMADCHLALVSSAVELVNALARWLCSRQDLLASSIDFLFRFLAQCPDDCARALLALCEANAPLLAPSLCGFLEATASALTVRDVALKPSTVNSLVKACGLLVVHASRQDVHFEPDTLMSAFQHYLQAKSASQGCDLATRLDKVCSFFRTVFQAKTRHGDRDLMQRLLHSFHSKLWACILACLQQKQSDVVETACNVLRYVTRCAEVDIEPFVPSIVDAILKCFKLAHCSCLLYLASVLLDELGEHFSAGQETDLDRLMTDSLLDDAYACLDSSRAYRKNPDLAEDLFRLCRRFAQRRPDMFLRSPQGQKAVELALTHCSHEHGEALPALLDFLTAVCTWECKNSGNPDAKYGPFLLSDDYRRTLMYRILRAVAKDELLNETKRIYAEFLNSLCLMLGSERVLKSMELALIELITELQTNEDVAQQVGQLLNELAAAQTVAVTGSSISEGELNNKIHSSTDKFKCFVFQLEDVFC